MNTRTTGQAVVETLNTLASDNGCAGFEDIFSELEVVMKRPAVTMHVLWEVCAKPSQIGRSAAQPLN